MRFLPRVGLIQVVFQDEFLVHGLTLRTVASVFNGRDSLGDLCVF